MYRGSVAPSSTVRRHQQQQHNDIFPLLDFKEIALCLQGCDMMADEDLLQRPTTQYINNLLEQIIDTFMGVSTRKLKSDLSTCSVDNEYPELQAEARMTMGMQRLMYRFLSDCGIDDFSIADVMKPEPQRFRRILSAVVNFARFREEHMNDCDDLVEKTDKNQRKLDQLGSEAEYLKQRIDELEHSKDPERVKEVEASNTEVESKLRELKKVQETLTEKHEQYRQERAKKLSDIENTAYLLAEAKKENEKIRPYIVESPEMLYKINNEMNASLATNKEELERYEKRQRLLDTSGESFKLIEQETKGLLRVLDECEAELHKEEDATARVNRYQELYEQRSLESQELERENQQLQRRIDMTQEKIHRATQQKAQKKGAVEVKMRELQDQYATLIAERDLNNQDMERKRTYIEKMELQMDQMKQQLESEMRSVAYENEQLQAHINRYLDGMEQRA